MKDLLSLDEYREINESVEWYVEQLRKKFPGILDEEIDYIIKSLFFNGHDGGVTEAHIDGVLEILNENIASTAIKAISIKKAQGAANKIKLKIAGLESKADDRKDVISKKPGKADGGMDREEKKKIKDKIDAQTSKQKEIMGKKITELESRAADKAEGNNFLSKYKATLKHKGVMKALEVELKNAEGDAAKEIQRKISEVKQKATETGQAAKKAATDAKSKEKSDDTSTKATDKKSSTKSTKEEPKVDKEETQADKDAARDNKIQTAEKALDKKKASKKKYEDEVDDINSGRVPYTDRDTKNKALVKAEKMVKNLKSEIDKDQKALDKLKQL